MDEKIKNKKETKTKDEIIEFLNRDAIRDELIKKVKGEKEDEQRDNNK